jgi:hypothetical protein
MWVDFSTTHITIIHISIEIKIFNLWDPSTGKIFTRTPGTHGHDGPYKGTPPPLTPSPGGAPTPAAPPSGGQPSGRESPSISLSPNPVTQGTAVTLSASGFAPNASLSIDVTRPSGVHDHFGMTTQSDGSGSFTFPTTGSSTELGTFTVTATNTATQASASASVQVLPAGGGTPSTPAGPTSTPAGPTSTPTDTGAGTTPSPQTGQTSTP